MLWIVVYFAFHLDVSVHFNGRGHFCVYVHMYCTRMTRTTYLSQSKPYSMYAHVCVCVCVYFRTAQIELAYFVSSHMYILINFLCDLLHSHTCSYIFKQTIFGWAYVHIIWFSSRKVYIRNFSAQPYRHIVVVVVVITIVSCFFFISISQYSEKNKDGIRTYHASFFFFFFLMYVAEVWCAAAYSTVGFFFLLLLLLSL